MKYSILILYFFITLSYSFPDSLKKVIHAVEDKIQSVENIQNGIIEQVNIGLNQFQNIIDGVKFTATFLWENVFLPTFDTIINGAKSFLHDKFSSLKEPIPVPSNNLSEKFFEMVGRLRSNVQKLFDELFLVEQDTLIGLAQGHQNFSERFQIYRDKIKSIHAKLNEWALETKSEFEAYANTIQGEWNDILSKYNHNIHVCLQSMGILFQELADDLVKNFLNALPTRIEN